MGMSDLPDLYALAQGPLSRANAYNYIRQITHAHATTNIFHLGETPVKCKKL